MSSTEMQIPRYNTLVVRGAAGTVAPLEVDGGVVEVWAVGHALAAQDPLLEFVQALAAGDYEGRDVSDIEAEANRVLELSRRQREQGWISNEEKRDD